MLVHELKRFSLISRAQHMLRGRKSIRQRTCSIIWASELEAPLSRLPANPHSASLAEVAELAFLPARGAGSLLCAESVVGDL